MIALALVMRSAALWGETSFDELRPHLVRQAQEVLDRELGTRMSAWTAEVVESVVGGAGPLPTDTMSYAQAIGEHREAITAMMRERLQSAMPELMHTVSREWMSRGGSGAVADAPAVDRAAEVLLERAMAPQLDGLATQWSEATVGTLLSCVKIEGRRMGPMEQQTCPAGVAIDPTNLRGTIDQIVQPQLLVNLVKRPLAEAIGQSTVDAIQDRLSTALKGELPKELHDYLTTGIEHFTADAKTLEQYLPGVQWDKWKDKLLGKTVIHLPNTVYGAMLAGSAARHFSKVICGPGCFNTYELERGLEVIQFLTWQLTQRQGIAISVGQLVGFLGKAGQELHIPDPSQWGKLGEALGKGKEKLQWFEDNLHKLDARYKQGVQTATAHMEQIVHEFEGKLLELQATLLTPVQQAIDMTNEGFGVIRGKLHEVVKPWDRMMQKVKDYFARPEGKPGACLSYATPGFTGDNSRCNNAEGGVYVGAVWLVAPGKTPPSVQDGRTQRKWPTDYVACTSAYYVGIRSRPAKKSDVTRLNALLRKKPPPLEGEEGGKGRLNGRWKSDGKNIEKEGIILKKNEHVEELFVGVVEKGEGGTVKKMIGEVYYRHRGMDVSTKGQLNAAVYAPEDGVIRRVSSSGFYLQTASGYDLHFFHTDTLLESELKRLKEKFKRGNKSHDMTSEQLKELGGKIQEIETTISDLPRKGLSVKAGNQIGVSSNKRLGHSGPHLHLEVCMPAGGACIDPRDYLPAENGVSCRGDEYLPTLDAVPPAAAEATSVPPKAPAEPLEQQEHLHPEGGPH